jgi:geranylgeranyl diphosphate synthase type II
MPIMSSFQYVRVAAPTFDFESYMKERAVMVNKALDEALPLRYPEVLVESMR